MSHEFRRVVLFDSADIHSTDADPVGFTVRGCILAGVRRIQGLVMPRRKKKFMLLKGKYTGNLIVVSRHWYDTTLSMSNRKLSMRYDRRWKIMAQSDDESMLLTMADLTDKHVRMRVDHTHEDEKGNLTNVRS